MYADLKPKLITQRNAT